MIFRRQNVTKPGKMCRFLLRSIENVFFSIFMHYEKFGSHKTIPQAYRYSPCYTTLLYNFVPRNCYTTWNCYTPRYTTANKMLYHEIDPNLRYQNEQTEILLLSYLTRDCLYAKIYNRIFVSWENTNEDILAKQVCKSFTWVTNLGTIHREVLTDYFLPRQTIKIRDYFQLWLAFDQRNSKSTKPTKKLMQTSWVQTNFAVYLWWCVNSKFCKDGSESIKENKPNSTMYHGYAVKGCLWVATATKCYDWLIEWQCCLIDLWWPS